MDNEIFNKIVNLPKDSSILVTLRPLKLSDIRELAAILAKNQLARHPYWINSEVPEDALQEFFEKVLAVHLSEDKSLVAVICEKIAGYIASYDFANHGAAEFFEQLYEKHAKIRENDEILEQFYVNCEDFSQPKEKEKVLLVTTLMVLKEFEGKGLGSLLFDFINYHPKCVKFSKILSECSSKGSEIICKRLGFSQILKKKWQEMGKPWENMQEKLKEKGISLENDGYSLMVLKR